MYKNIFNRCPSARKRSSPANKRGWLLIGVISLAILLLVCFLPVWLLLLIWVAAAAIMILKK